MTRMKAKYLLTAASVAVIAGFSLAACSDDPPAAPDESYTEAANEAPAEHATADDHAMPDYEVGDHSLLGDEYAHEGDGHAHDAGDPAFDADAGIEHGEAEGIELADEIDGFSTIMSVNSVVLSLAPDRSALTIMATGTVRTGGWSEPQLVAHDEEPVDGILHFEFVAVAPDGPVTQALEPVTVTLTIDPLPEGVSAVRVVAEENEVVQELAQNAQ
jgi:hypothetical protein